jgi:hypothetical protein
MINLLILWNWIVRWKKILGNYKSKFKSVTLLLPMQELCWFFQSLDTSDKVSVTQSSVVNLRKFLINICWLFAISLRQQVTKSIHKYSTQIKAEIIFLQQIQFSPHKNISSQQIKNEKIFFSNFLPLEFKPAKFYRFLFIEIFIGIQRIWQ